MKSAVEPAVLIQKSSHPFKTHHLMHIAMVIAVSCWAANMVAVKEALNGFGPMALSLVRAMAVALVFGFLFLLLREWSFMRLTRRQWVQFGVIAFFGVTVNQILFIYGVAYTNIPHAALIIAIEPVMVLILSVVMRLEVLTTLKFVGMTISFAGVVLLTYGKPAQGSQAYWLGDLILMVEVVVFAYYTILMKEVVNQYDVVTLNTVVFGLGALMMIPFGARAVLHVNWSQVPVRAVFGLGFMTFFSCVIGYLLFAYALQGLTASRVAAFNYIEPVMGTALGVWLLHDKVGLWGILGGGLILLGVYFTEWERGEEEAA
ncbi:MAG: DMT family transporter [Acidobacteria bacterium]|nr:MAG: DMT family transporter [Acidobacteriota bacterium]